MSPGALHGGQPNPREARALFSLLQGLVFVSGFFARLTDEVHSGCFHNSLQLTPNGSVDQSLLLPAGVGTTGTLLTAGVETIDLCGL